MSAQDSTPAVFDIFLCHNSEDKPAVREIAQKLSEVDINPWLDEADIIGGSFWHDTIGQQIETVKSAAVFIGQRGVGPWQRREIIALLDQFDRRGCPVIPVILASAPANVALPWSLLGLHCIDFRAADSLPLKRLIWAITGQRPEELSALPSSEKPATMASAAEAPLVPGNGYQVETSKAHLGDQEVASSRLYPPLAEQPNQQDRTQLEILRRRVMEYWVDGVLKHSLYKEVLISLGKQQNDEFVDAPWKYTVELPDETSSGGLGALADRTVTAIYDATGLLLILGEPGSGKTTTLLDLARTLLERAGKDIRERVAVVLNLSSWKKKHPLAEWICVELSEKYRVPRKIARLWLQHDYLVPLLDGLDEVETSIQPDCVAAIDAFIEESNPSGLVVCCRLNEYRWLPERLKLNGAIRVEPLTEGGVDEYLRMSGAELAALRKALNTDPVLQELAQTPLMLSIMSLAYQGVGGDELAPQIGGSPEERRTQIFYLYVERMFQRKGTASLLFPKEKTIAWLSWLAEKMKEHSQSLFLVEGLQPRWLGTRAQRLAYGTVVASSFALIFGLTSGLMYGLIYGLIGGLSSGLGIGLLVLLGVGLGSWSKSPLKNGIMSGLIPGLIFGLILGPRGELCLLCTGLYALLLLTLTLGVISGLGIGSLKHVTLVETISWKWNRFWKWTIPGAVFGLILELIDRLISGDGLGMELVWLIEGLTLGLIGGLVSGLIGGFTDRVKPGKVSRNQGIKLSRKNSLAIFFVTLLIFELIFGLIGVIGWYGLLVPIFELIFALILGTIAQIPEVFFGLRFSGPFGLIPMLSFGLIFGMILALIGGLNRGGSAVIKHYALRLILWLNGYTPFKFIKFLDHCDKLILLKKVGGGYIFVHRMLLDYFADLSVPSKKS